MKIIGLTGGIGSGKSTVANEFESLGIPIFIADDASKHLLATNSKVIIAVKDLLGERAYQLNKNGQSLPDKKYIAQQVFNDKILLSALNKIMHPAVRLYFDHWISEQVSPYIIYEAAILFETDGHHLCDEVILITASIEERFKRVMTRDQVNREEVQLRMDKQWSDFQRLELSNYVIINEDIQKLNSFVSSIHEVLLK